MAPTTTAATTARERQRAQFLAQFAATVFAQWRQAREKERFWLDAAFLRTLLEEAAAKLPSAAALKGELTRELPVATAELRRLLDALYADLQTQQPAPESGQQLLLSEENVERALATADAATRRELAARLALDEDEASVSADVAQVEALVAQLQLVGARAYESESEQSRKRALLVQRVVRSAEQLVRGWASGNWDCAPTSAASVELQRLRVALQRVVVVDAVLAVASDVESSSNALLGAPWSAFYRPPESAQLAKANYEAEIAKLYGLLLTLAVYFPIVLEDEDTSDESSSDSDSDESESEQARRSARVAAGSKQLDAVEQAKLTMRHVVFAARKRVDASWLVAALTFLHGLPKPKSYKDTEDEESALEAADLRALQDCLCDVYTRALAHPEVLANYSLTQESKSSDWELFETVVCVRRAAQFMRTERRQTIPAVTTAMTKLASIPLPTSFWEWIAHAKKVFAQQPAAVREVTKKLSKSKSVKMASALLSATEVTDAELEATAEVR